jgi:sugar O-acyltransferase (sialic acid O-acetyltransferase NeuD family)
MIENKKIALIGGGGHGKVCASVAEELGYDVTFFDDAFPKVSSCGKWRVSGTKLDLIKTQSNFDTAFVAIGNCKIRAIVQRELESAGFEIANLISKASSVHHSVKLGKGILVVGNSTINIDTTVSDGAIINTNASVDHDSIINEFAHICPGVNLAGEVSVGYQSWVGIGSSVIQQVNIGSNSFVVAGAVVINDIPDNAKAFGVPACVMDSL